MIRGTTPTHTFTLPISVDDVDKIRIIYAQGGVKIVKTNADCTMEGKTVTTTLTQEDTLGMNAGSASVQVRFIDSDGVAQATEKAVLNIEDVLLEKVIVYADDSD